MDAARGEVEKCKRAILISMVSAFRWLQQSAAPEMNVLWKAEFDFEIF